MIVRCAFCHEPVDTDRPGAFRRVTGWEKNRDQGGTNAVALRQPHDDWACAPCIDLAVKGLLGQASLI